MGPPLYDPEQRVAHTVLVDSSDPCIKCIAIHLYTLAKSALCQGYWEWDLGCSADTFSFKKVLFDEAKTRGALKVLREHFLLQFYSLNTHTPLIALSRLGQQLFPDSPIHMQALFGRACRCCQWREERKPRSTPLAVGNLLGEQKEKEQNVQSFSPSALSVKGESAGPTHIRQSAGSATWLGSANFSLMCMVVIRIVQHIPDVTDKILMVGFLST